MKIPSLGIYKKLLLKDNRLRGRHSGRRHLRRAPLHGMAARRRPIWRRIGVICCSRRRQPTRAWKWRRCRTAKSICGCNGVSKGTIIQAIHEHGITTLGELKERTRASTSCGSCTGLCQQLLRAVAAGFPGGDARPRCAPACRSPTSSLREIVRGQQLKSVQEVLNVYGNRKGCEVCKPALSYMLDMLWCGDHEEDRSARFINDRVHANIQKDGTFSVVPRMRGGVTSPDELRRIADVADKYNVPMVKVTGSQRIDLLGVKKADLPKVWARSRNAFGPSVHQGRPHGEDLRGDRILPLRRAGFDQRGDRAGAASGKSLHAAQGQDGRGRMSRAIARRRP